MNTGHELVLKTAAANLRAIADNLQAAKNPDQLSEQLRQLVMFETTVFEFWQDWSKHYVCTPSA